MSDRVSHEREENHPVNLNIEKGKISWNTSAIILAADEDERTLKECKTDSNILLRQVRILSLVGIQKERIYIVSRRSALADQVGCKQVLCASVHSGGALLAGLEAIGATGRTIVIHGNTYCTTNNIDSLMQSPHNCILVSPAMNTEQLGTFVVGEQKLQYISTSVDSMPFPRRIYAGMMILEPYLFPFLRKIPSPDLESDIHLVWRASSMSDVALSILSVNHQPKNSLDLIGGSFGGLVKKTIVQKEASGQAGRKLLNEINWLLDLPDELKPRFSQVLKFETSSTTTSYWMPYYDYPCLRKLILLQQIDVNEVSVIMDNVLSFVFNELYVDVSDTPPDYVEKKHFDRVLLRLKEVREQNKVIDGLASKQLYLNGRLHTITITDFLEKVRKDKFLTSLLHPEKLCRIHGDLHFQNILVKNAQRAEFLLVDPRGELGGSDVYYDMGKLFHSFNGMYDVIHVEDFVLEIKETRDAFYVRYEQSDALIREQYAAIKQMMLPKMRHHLGQDANWELRCLLIEIMHFSSLFTFHVKGDGVERRAVALYCTAMQLIQQFCDRYEAAKEPEIFDSESTAFQPLEAVFFDLDDTLVDTSKADSEAYCAVASLLLDRGISEQRVDCIIETFKRKFHLEPWHKSHTEHAWVTREKFWKEALGDALSEETESSLVAHLATKTFRDTRLAHLRISPTVASAITALRSRGVRVGIITNGHEIVQREKLSVCGAYLYFDPQYIILGGEETLAGRDAKPSKSIFQTACVRAGVSPSRAMYVGDSWDVDMVGAKNANFYWQVWLSSTRTSQQTWSVSATFGTLDELFLVLEKNLDERNSLPRYLTNCE